MATYGAAATLELLPNTPRGTRARVRIPRALPAGADVPQRRVVIATLEQWEKVNRHFTQQAR